jgi:hypothetical protein
MQGGPAHGGGERLPRLVAVKVGTAEPSTSLREAVGWPHHGHRGCSRFERARLQAAPLNRARINIGFKPPPATNIAARLFLRGFEFLAQRRLFVSARRKREQTDGRRAQPLRRPRSVLDQDAQKLPTAQSNLRRSRIAHVAVETTTTRRCGGATGAGVPRPVHPKSQTQRRAIANANTDGAAANHRQRAAPAISTLKPSHRGSSHNHREKNAAPTATEAAADSRREPSPASAVLQACTLVMSTSSAKIVIYSDSILPHNSSC